MFVIQRHAIILTMELNQPAPDFALPDLDGQLQRLSDYRGRIVILNFWSCDCPHSERTDGLMTAWLAKWRAQVVLLSIAANRSESAEAVAEAARARSLPRVLLDAQQVVADLYQAQTTPHVFVMDKEAVLRYRGAVDDVSFGQSRPRTATRFFLEEAVDSLLEGREPAPAETPAYGCTIVRAR